MAKIIIIGGGVSGLSAGIYSQMKGYNTVICERHNLPGGNLTGWRRGEYEIDNCIHWLTGTNPNTSTYRMWEELGALGQGIEVFQGDTLYTCRQNGEELSLYKDIDVLKNKMDKISPEDKKEISSLISAVKLAQKLCGIGGDGHNERLDGIKSLYRFPTLAKYYMLTAKELSLRFKHPLLRDFIGSFWGEGFGALALVFVFAHFCGENGGIPQYGSMGMAKRMADRYTSLGGELILGNEVVRVNHLCGRATSVTLSDGNQLFGDYFILTTDPAVAFKHLLRLSLPSQLDKMYHDPRFKRFSSIQCAFSVKIDRLDFRGDLVVSVPDKHLKAIGSQTIVIREFSHEKSYAPEGETVLQVMAFCDEADCLDAIRQRELNRGAYIKRKNNFADASAEIIEKAIPSLKDELTLLDVWTPATYRRYVDSEIGSYMSFIMPSKMIPARKNNEIKGLSNVFIATQWQQCPGGLPIAAACGQDVANKIDAIEKKATSEVPSLSPAPTPLN